MGKETWSDVTPLCLGYVFTVQAAFSGKKFTLKYRFPGSRGNRSPRLSLSMKAPIRTQKSLTDLRLFPVVLNIIKNVFVIYM
jgi:hypothetical protein